MKKYNQASNPYLIRFFSMIGAISLVQAEVLDSISFETSEGYLAASPWVGQQSWNGSRESDGDAIDDRASGFVSDLADLGQQAYIGGRITPVEDLAQKMVKHEVFQNFPLNVTDQTVRCSMKIFIHVADPGSRDQFGFVLNELGLPHTLFSVSVNSATGQIFAGSRTSPQETDLKVDFDVVHDLSFVIDYENSLWSGFLDDKTILEDQPLQSLFGGRISSFGSILFLWSDTQQQVANAGASNYMLVDELLIETVEEPSSNLESAIDIGDFVDGQSVLEITGEGGESYSLERSGNLEDWSPFFTFQMPDDGKFSFPVTIAPPQYFRVSGQ